MKSGKKKVTQKMIYRAVASSTAIETRASVRSIEQKLKDNKGKYRYLSLAH
ncbi:hypothetical protein [Shewanella sp. YLB-07]|uniref:hypothetical protein n=1 Tax=Shewanella sp. YLB-07 TaxID=2601268 RepID=UPI001883F70B|nr:hypothetical protein [Shewanella sp. YLB-07]